MQASVPLKVVEKRLVLVFFAFFLAGLVLQLKLISVQAIQSDKFGNYATNQRLRRLEIPAIRGKVTDRNGEILASSVLVKSVYATPYLIKKPDQAARKISRILGMDYNEIKSKLSRKSGFAYIKRKIPVETADKLKKLDLEGIGYLDEVQRIYPAKNVGAHLVGFTSIDNRGFGGVEQKLDKILAGKSGELIVERDPYGRIIPGGISKEKHGYNGKNVRLTIDQSIQYVAQSKLDEAVKKYKASSGSVIAMDVNNGEILALVNSPTFDPNLPKKKLDILRNKAISDVYEPGSTMKTILAAGALEDGIVNPEQKFFLRSTIRVGNKTVKEAHRSTAKTFTFSEIIQESSNIGAITVGLKMGKEKLYNWIERFGLTKRTGIDLPAEGSGFLPSTKNWSKTTIGNVPIGQGVTVTPLQLLRSLATIVNGGYSVEPKIILDSGKGKINTSRKREKIISSETSVEMRKILHMVVEKGTADLAKIPGYAVGGKTGTAQKPKTNGRGYESGKYIASFVGFFPVDKPKIAMIVVLDNPKPIWGGVVAAPTFSEVGKFIISRQRISPN